MCLMWVHAMTAPTDKKVWYTLWLSDWGPPGKAGWSGGGGGEGCILGHFMKKGCNHGSKPRGGLNYAWLNKAQGYQQAMSQQTLPHSGAPDSRRTLLRGHAKKRKNKPGHKNIAQDKSLDCVTTRAGTLKLNFSEAFKTLLKRKHSHSHEVKRYITEFMLPINHLKRWDGPWSCQRQPMQSTKSDLLTNRGHDSSNKRIDNSPRDVCFFCLKGIMSHMAVLWCDSSLHSSNPGTVFVNNLVGS